MAKLTVNIGSSANDRTGDNLRTAFNKLNSNFDEIYLSVDTLTSQVATITGSGTSNSASGNTIVGDIQGSVVGEDSTVLVDGVNSNVNAANLTGNLPALDGSALTNLTIPAQTFASLTSKPTTVAGYGITDAYTKTEVDSSIASVTAGHFDFNITGDDSTVRTVTSGDTLQITGGTGITTASDADGNITITGVAQDFTFASLTGTPTTIAGYGITDALALGTSSTTALAGDTALFSGAFADLTSKPTTIAGYGITDALALGTSSTTALAGDTALFDGAYGSLTGAPTMYANSDVDAHLNQSNPTSGYVLSWDGTDYAWDAAAIDREYLKFDDSARRLVVGPLAGGTGKVEVGEIVGHEGQNLYLSSYDSGAVSTHISLNSTGTTTTSFISGTTVDFTGATVTGLSVSGLQSRGSVTGTTGSLADAAEENLDITGFKSYALLTITTDRAARVRLYVTAATRTADASRAEGVDPTSDAGLIAEVITTGADTVIISPGAYGFNLEGTPTTTIPCRVTNKSGSTSTVQVDLNILQLEA